MFSGELTRFFWDVDPEKLDLERHKTFIIERILELGDEAAVRWLFAAYPRPDIILVLRAARALSPKSHGFWTLVLEETAPLLRPVLPYQAISVASLEDIGCMKIEAIASRGRKRDFVDLFFILIQTATSLKTFLDLFRRKYGRDRINLFHVLKSLTYFVDAEADPDPIMLVPFSWAELKTFVSGQVKSVARI
jgi:hypothetical protein